VIKETDRMKRTGKNVGRLIGMICLLCSMLFAAACGSESTQSGKQDNVKEQDSNDGKSKDDGKKEESDKKDDKTDNDKKDNNKNDDGKQNGDNGKEPDDGKQDVASDLPITFYLYGDNSVAVLVKSEACEKYIPKEGGEPAEYIIEANGNFLNFHFSYYDRSLNVDTGNNWIYFYKREGEFIVTPDTYFTIFTGDNLCNYIKAEGEIRLCETKFESSDRDELATVDMASAVKRVDRDGLVALIDSVIGTKPKGSWSGTYLANNSDELNGYATITVSDGGAIVVDARLDGKDREFIGWEDTENATIGDTYFSSRLMVMNMDTDKNWTSIDYHSEKYTDSEINEFIYISTDRKSTGAMDKFQQWHNAPEGYVDEDRTGEIFRTDPEDSQYFTPDSDDYTLTVYKNTEDGRKYDIKCDLYYLYSFNENGFSLGLKKKYVCKTEEDAAAIYDYRKEDSSFECHLSGNLLYMVPKSDSSWYYTKFSVISDWGYDKWYVGCNYCYGSRNDDGTYYMQMYISKPYTEAEYNVTLEDVLFWQSVPSGAHRSLDSKEPTMSINPDEYRVEVSFNGDIGDDEEKNKKHMASPDEIRFTGRNIVGVTFSSMYDYETGKYVKYLVFAEMSFTEEVAEVTEYFFEAEDPFSSDVNLSNFKTKNATFTLSQRYDMKRTK
jgi:hypothetical protein